MLSSSLLLNKELFTTNKEIPLAKIHQRKSPKARSHHKHTKSFSNESNTAHQMFNRTTVVKMVKKRGPDLVLNIRQLNVGADIGYHVPLSFRGSRQAQEAERNDSHTNENPKLSETTQMVNGSSQPRSYILSPVQKYQYDERLNEITGIEGIKFRETNARATTASRLLRTRRAQKFVTAPSNLTNTKQETVIPSLTSIQEKQEKRDSRNHNLSIDQFIEETAKENVANLHTEEAEQESHEESSDSIAENLNNGSAQKKNSGQKQLNLIISSLDEQKLEAKLKRTTEAYEAKNYSLNNIGCKTEPNEEFSFLIHDRPQINKNLRSTLLDGWSGMKAKKSTSDQTGKSINQRQQQAEMSHPNSTTQKKPRTKNNIRIKTISDNNPLKSLKKIRNEIFDIKIIKTCKRIRTIEENILSPLNDSSSDEENSFTEYVEALKSENNLRTL